MPAILRPRQLVPLKQHQHASNKFQKQRKRCPASSEVSFPASWDDMPEEIIAKIMVLRASSMYQDVMKSCKWRPYYVVHEDSGHAWLEVPLSELVKANLHHHISPFSYMHESTAYLEEDCDWPMFQRATPHIWNKLYRNIYPERSFIRNFDRFDCMDFVKGTRCLCMLTGDLEDKDAKDI